jgi:hypothetical protein
MAEAPFARAPMVDRILQSRSLASPTPSVIGFQMTDFRRKLFSQETGRAPPVLFDTAVLSSLYPFATARTHCRDGFLLSAAFARKHARAADVSN